MTSADPRPLLRRPACRQPAGSRPGSRGDPDPGKAAALIAAGAAFDATPELDAIKAIYAENRRILLDRLPAIGFDEFHPVDGAFYVYASVGRFSNDSLDFTRRMLVEAGVATTPGLDFDRIRGSQWLRFSFAGTTPDMIEAMDRIEGWLG